jgi:glycosyltransferase involved in cell wall biosynthesis
LKQLLHWKQLNNSLKRLAIITTHPIQYNAPLFQLLHQRGKISLHVYYTWGQSKEVVFDERFGVQRSWDVPLLERYEHEFVKNTSSTPDSNRFFGIINPGLKKKLKQEQYDAVFIYRWSVWSHLLLMTTNWSKTKLWFRGDSHVTDSNRSGIKNICKKLLLNFIYKKTDRVFYTGRKNKAYFNYYGVAEHKLTFMPHAVDNSRFTNDEVTFKQKAQEERINLGIADDAVVFLYAGKFYDIKNLNLLIKAFKQLNGKQYRLLLYGSGILESQLQQLAKEDQRIIFRPFHNQSAMPWVYRAGDVYVLPSKSETWGLGVNEAMACGLPAVVSSNCGCAPELIIEEKTGFVFGNNDETHLLQQLKKFNTRATAQQYGVMAQQHIQQFSLEQQATVLEKCLTGTI